MFNPNREEVQPKPRGFNAHEMTAAEQEAFEAAKRAEQIPPED